MNYHSENSAQPSDVTFFIGPIESPAGKKAHQIALALNDQGDRSALDELLEIQQKGLRELAGCSSEQDSPLKRFLEAAIGREISEFPTFVATGYIDKTWTPILTIYLDRLKASDGSLLGHLVKKVHGKGIAAFLGKTFKAEWICTSWAYPGTPIDLSSSRHLKKTKEG